jgi:hypothetical protein
MKKQFITGSFVLAIALSGWLVAATNQVQADMVQCYTDSRGCVIPEESPKPSVSPSAAPEPTATPIPTVLPTEPTNTPQNVCSE